MFSTLFKRIFHLESEDLNSNPSLVTCYVTLGMLLFQSLGLSFLICKMR